MAMAMKRSYVAVIISILVPLIVTVTVGATNSDPLSSLAEHCVNEITGLVPCLDFVTNDKIKNVSPQCCSAIGATVKSNVLCLCLLFTNNSDSAGLAINQTQALLLPTLCKVTVPPLSACQHLGDVSSPPRDESRPVSKGPADQNQGRSSSDSSQSGRPISFITTIIVSFSILLSLMTVFIKF